MKNSQSISLFKGLVPNSQVMIKKVCYFLVVDGIPLGYILQSELKNRCEEWTECGIEVNVNKD